MEVLSKRVKSLTFLYIIGYILPLLTTIVLFLISFLAGLDFYLLRSEVYQLWSEEFTRRGAVEACYLSPQAVPFILVPAGLVSLVNLYLVLRIVYSVHNHGRTRFTTRLYSQRRLKKYPRYIRNMIILSLLLGSTWLLAWLPYSKVLAYLHVLLNGLTGVYILGNK